MLKAIIMSYKQSQNTQTISRIMISTQKKVPTVSLRHLDTIVEESQHFLRQERREFNTQTEIDSGDEIEEDEIHCPLLTDIDEKVNENKKLIDLCSFIFFEIEEI
jgi:hypothetical protein